MNAKHKCFEFILMDRKWVDVCKEGSEIMGWVWGEKFVLFNKRGTGVAGYTVT